MCVKTFLHIIFVTEFRIKHVIPYRPDASTHARVTHTKVAGKKLEIFINKLINIFFKIMTHTKEKKTKVADI